VGTVELIAYCVAILFLYGALIADAHVDTTVEYNAPPREEVKKVILIGTSTPPIETEEQIVEEIKRVFHEEPELALAIMKCESGLVPTAEHWNTNGTVDKGIAQLNSVHDLSGVDVWNPKENLRFARKLYDERGQRFTDWVCYVQKLY